MSSYYSHPSPSDEEIGEVEDLCSAAGVATFNTRSIFPFVVVEAQALTQVTDRLFKDSAKELTLLIASASTTLPESYPSSLTSDKLGFVLKFRGGDHSESLAKVNTSLLAASEFAATENQKQMLIDYIASQSFPFVTHKGSSELSEWANKVANFVLVKVSRMVMLESIKMDRGSG